MAVASACDLWVEQQVLGLIDRSTRLLPDLFADLMVAAKATVGIDKAGGLMVALAREQVDLPEVMFDWILRTTIDDGLEALEEQRSSERWAAARTIEAAKAAAKTDHRSTKQARREQLGQVVAAGNVIESIERLASRPVRIPEMAKLLEKLDEVVDRGQEINVTVNVDEDRLGEAIARAMKPRADVEVLAMNATGKPSLMRRSDGTVRRLEYDPDGAIIAMRQVEDVEAELAFLSAGKGSEKAAGVEELREWARSPQLGDVSESARRVLRSKRLTW